MDPSADSTNFALARSSASAEEPDGLDEWITLLKALAPRSTRSGRMSECSSAQAGFTRLLVVRVIGKAKINAAYRAPTDKAEKRKHLAGIRCAACILARCHSSLGS